ncbi:hypothetical protein [Winogradskyella sp.]|uniref:hypothetical protein n=1 Tax=Winogradskyella sp. TaxID=1883156 RepID=UPI003F6CC999
MIKKIIVLLVLINSVLFANGQNDLNDYKYILVPNEFEFSKIKDQYNLNSLAKFLFNKQGFSAYLEDEKLPNDLKNARCLALTVEVINAKSGLFKTKLEIILRDCDGNEIMRSQVGESRLKKYDRAYNEAFRIAFKSIENLDYSYNGNVNKVEEVSEAQVDSKEDEKTSTEGIGQEVEKDNIETKTTSKEVENTDVLYAQAIEEGYQLVNKEPKVVMILFNTSTDQIYIVKGKDAIVYKEKGSWIYYEPSSKTKIKKELIIKF